MSDPRLRDYRYGSTTGVDLLAPVKLNLNPYDIISINGQPPSSIWEKWRYFYGFISKYLDRNDVSLNNEEINRKVTTKFIDDFNNNKDISAWAKFGTSSPYRGANNPITREDIFAIQRFTQKADPRVIVDGWLGTQTLQMNYPAIATKVIKVELDKLKALDEKYWPVVWGDKRFVITVKNSINYDKNNPQPLGLYLIPYNPSKHDSNFVPKSNFNKDWVLLGQTSIPVESAEKINSETIKQSNEKNNLKTQTKISKSL
jgi:hypothetical protein